MTVAVTLAQVPSLAPNAGAAYLEAFAAGQPALDRHGISANPLRVAHFMAQVLHETCALTGQVENLSYSAAQLCRVWPARFRPRGPLDPEAYAGNAEKLANAVYGRRMGNGEPGDGYTYRGRGLLQLTGRAAYEQASRRLRAHDPDAPDFAAQPDRVIMPRWCLHLPACEWQYRGCNPAADRDSLRAVTLAINGGTCGLAERARWLRRTRAVWCPEPPAA